MPEIGKYIYGIINSNKELTLGPRFSSEAEERCNQAKEGGIAACETVKSIPYQDISAVASDLEIADYTYMQRDVLARNLVRHQKVIERLTPKCTIIPMKLGTFAKDEDEVILILSKGYQLTKEIFGKIAGSIEIDVVSTWSNFPYLLKETGEEGQIKEFKQMLLANSKGVTVDEQMKVGLMVQKAVERKNEDCAKMVLDTLKAVSQEFKVHARMDDEMIANYAFLIDKTRVGSFYKKVEGLNRDFGGKANFRCVGPLPSYSFYTLEIKKLEFEEIDWARKKLGILDELTTKDVIKNAYHRQAFSFHPDKNPDNPRAEKEFEEIKRSYDILLDYVQSYGQSGQGKGYSFREEEFRKNSIFVRIKE